jgi:hypothetical protein
MKPERAVWMVGCLWLLAVLGYIAVIIAIIVVAIHFISKWW